MLTQFKAFMPIVYTRTVLFFVECIEFSYPFFSFGNSYLKL